MVFLSQNQRRKFTTNTGIYLPANSNVNHNSSEEKKHRERNTCNDKNLRRRETESSAVGSSLF